MALIEWNDSYSVKVAEIDSQHRKLIDMINELDAAMREGKGRTVVGEIVRRLFAYTGTHFRTEERYFEQYGYPGTDAHKKEHLKFVDEVAKFKEGFEKGSISLTIQVMSFLSSWLRTHIQGTDRKYSAFFNAKGLK